MTTTTITAPVRMYASGGFDIYLTANPPSNSHDAGCAISGHLVAQ